MSERPFKHNSPIPTQREIDVYITIHGGNRHDRKHAEQLKGDDIPPWANNVRVIERIDRFSGEYLGEGDLGDYDWIGEMRYADGSRDVLLHHKDGDVDRNMVTIYQPLRLYHPQHEAVIRKITKGI